MNWYKISQNSDVKKHKVLKGETLSAIAKKYFNDPNMWNEILKFNPQIKNANEIKENDIINIPNLENKTTAIKPEEKKQNLGVDNSSFKEYIVVKGDSLSSIAKNQLGDEKRWKEIQEINGIKDPSSISIGDKIKIPLIKRDNSSSDKTNNDLNSALAELKRMISSSEGGYGSYNRGKSGDNPNPNVDITKLKIKDIMYRQSLPREDPNRLFAVGKYQFIPVTLKEAIANKKLGVTVEDIFSPQNQEKLFLHLLYKRSSLMAYLSGKSDNLNAAVDDLAREFASLPLSSGVGNYDGDKAGNKAKGGMKRVQKIKAILQTIRDSGVFK